MRLSPHSLHPIAARSAADKAHIASTLRSIADGQRRVIASAAGAAPADNLVIPLTTVSLNSNFDAYINIQFRGQVAGSMTTLLVDSGNSVLIVPDWEDLKDLPGYTVLGEAKEPWGSPAKVVRGPIEIPTATGGIHTLEDCVFYACTDSPRTANFGTGCLSPWSASGWNTPQGLGVTMQSPLSYNSEYPFAEFNYAPGRQLMLALQRTRQRWFRNRNSSSASHHLLATR